MLFFNILIGLFFVACGLLVKRFPIPAMLIPLILYISYQVLIIGIDGSNLMRGSAWKIAIIFMLGYGIYNSIIASKIKKELIEAAKKMRYSDSNDAK